MSSTVALLLLRLMEESCPHATQHMVSSWHTFDTSRFLQDHIRSRQVRHSLTKPVLKLIKWALTGDFIISKALCSAFHTLTVDPSLPIDSERSQAARLPVVICFLPNNIAHDDAQPSILSRSLYLTLFVKPAKPHHAALQRVLDHVCRPLNAATTHRCKS
jgi:hypothetical protein